MFNCPSERDARPDTGTYWPFWYVGHGKGPPDGLGLDIYRNSPEFTTPPPLVALPQTCLCHVCEFWCVQVDSCGAHFGEATSGYIPHVD